MAGLIDPLADIATVFLFLFTLWQIFKELIRNNKNIFSNFSLSKLLSKAKQYWQKTRIKVQQLFQEIRSILNKFFLKVKKHWQKTKNKVWQLIEKIKNIWKKK